MKTRRLLFPVRTRGVRRLWPLLLAGLAATLAGCGDSGAAVEGGPRYHPAESLQLQRQSGYSVARTFIGRVQARQSASVGFEQGGKVARVLVDEGDSVDQGDLLAQQDVELLQVEGQQLQAELARIDADLALVRANLERQRSLNHRGYGSEQGLDELQARRQGLTASRRSLESSLEANRLRIEKASLRAPFDAVVNRRRVDVGEVLGAGTPVLELLQRGGAEVRVGVPVELLHRLAVGSRQPVTIGDRTLHARLLTRGSDVDPVTRTVQLRFALDDGAEAVNGQLAYLALEQRYEAPGYWVPLAALTDGPRGLWNLYTLQPAPEAGLYDLQSHNVRVLHATAERAYVSAELGDGTRVLTAGLQRLVPGQRVQPAAAGQLAEATP